MDRCTTGHARGENVGRIVASIDGVRAGIARRRGRIPRPAATGEIYPAVLPNRSLRRSILSCSAMISSSAFRLTS